jgi:hypothetical protein
VNIGAAKKKHNSVRLDHVIDYGDLIDPLCLCDDATQPSGTFFFMNSPGNDIESIAGQVACGCNMILFITGNGSITNFPFVPTIKIVTTSARMDLLKEDMDFNAGRFQEGYMPYFTPPLSLSLPPPPPPLSSKKIALSLSPLYIHPYIVHLFYCFVAVGVRQHEANKGLLSTR